LGLAASADLTDVKGLAQDAVRLQTTLFDQSNNCFYMRIFKKRRARYPSAKPEQKTTWNTFASATAFRSIQRLEINGKPTG